MGAQNLFFPLVNMEFPLCVNLKSIFNNVFCITYPSKTIPRLFLSFVNFEAEKPVFINFLSI